MYRVRNQIDCEMCHQNGITGENITVAILDTGIVSHPDFDNRILCFKDFTKGIRKNYDDSSHGTHVCGIVAGSGMLSDRKYRGIAPRCNLVVGKILDKNGDGEIENMLAGIEWILRIQKEYQIKILNISVGIGNSLNTSIEYQAIKAVEKAWRAGLVVVSAAGNGGPKPMSISAIGASDLVLTVGCHEGGYFGNVEGLCESYSARGPSKYALKKPDIVAPGTRIVSCSSGVWKNTMGQYKNAYIKKSGTSMSTPIISGACALLLQRFPYYSNEDVKRRLLYTATDLNEIWAKQGWGMINIERMLFE